MYERIGDFLNHRYPDQRVNYHLVHGQAAWQDELKKKVELQTVGDDQKSSILAESWFTPRKRTLLAPFGVGTVDQTFMSILQTRHFFVRLFGLSHKVIIFDEVHAYDTFMSTLFERLLIWLNAIGTSVIILSATLPAETRRKLVEAYSGQPLTRSGEYPSLTIAASGSEPVFIELPKPAEVTVQLAWDVGREPDAMLDYLRRELANGGCAAVICNTVRRAQDIFRALDDARQTGTLDLLEDDLILFHARFPPIWRQAIERTVLAKFGKPDKNGRSPNRPRRAIVVATQVIEQSLDLDFDLMLTDLAPIDLIIQRAGRLHRHDRSEAERHGLPRRLIITEPAEMDTDSLPKFEVDEYIYARYVLLRSFYALKAKGDQAIFPTDTTTLIEQVYGDMSLLEGMTGEQLVAIRAAEKEMRREQHEAIRKAKRQLVLEPNEPDLLKQDMENLEEDNPNIHRTLRTQTRDIDDGISLICLHRKEERTFIYTLESKLEINLTEEVPFQQIKHIQQNRITVQHKTLFYHFIQQEPPPAWQKQAALRHQRVVIFEEGHYTKIPKYTLKLSRRFGLETIKQEET
jgi:CRISPR-associated endonuclease/helicase Cas3